MLRQRVVTAVIALVIVVAAVLWCSFSWQVLVFVGCLLCAYEFAAITGQRWSTPAAIWSYAVVALLIWWPHGFGAYLYQWMVAITFLIPVLTRNRANILQSASLFAGAMYIGFGGASLVALRSLENGLAWVFLTMITIWATDTAAYFIGSSLKGPKLWPDISPKKTVSGAVAGVIAGGLGAVFVGWLTIQSAHPLRYFYIGALISVAGQLGDLVESAYKRSAGVKDSGNLLPGHGGVLDRVDSLLFAAPLAVFLITHPWS